MTGGHATGGEKPTREDFEDQAATRAIETDVGPRLARVAESIADDNLAKQELNLLLQEMDGTVGARKAARGGRYQPQVFSMATGVAEVGRKGAKGEGENSRGAERGDATISEAGREGTNTENKRAKQAATLSEGIGEGSSRTDGESGMAEVTCRARAAVEDMSSKLDGRAALFRDRAEALQVEPMRPRIAELDMQAKMGGRNLFRDMVTEGVDAEEIASAWIAKYTNRHGFK